jgi:hydrogenase maturation protease
MNQSLPLCVVGLGSAHGDDAAAWHVVRQIEQHRCRWPGSKFHVLEGPERILDILGGSRALAVVDATYSYSTPGSVHRLSWPDPRIGSWRSSSTHAMSVAQTLEMARALGSLPATVMIFGIEGRCFNAGAGLSATVDAAVPEIAARIECWLEELSSDGGS